MKTNRPAMLYNLFPLLAGPFSRWRQHLERAARMGFNWVFVNPVSYPGFSGSLYAVKDYFSFNSLLLDERPDLDQFSQFRAAVNTAHELGLRFMIDLVINHTAIDSLLVREHPAWYKRDRKGKIKNPGVWEGDKLVTVWGDLAEIDNEGSPERESLWEYWGKLVDWYINQGIDGFRCDAAYKVPAALWRNLIPRARERNVEVAFFAESLGCTVDKVVMLAESGFDYVFNSSKYWDYLEPWCLSQYEQSRQLAPSVSFPESHDTPRLAAELKDCPDAVRQRYTFAALFSTGLLLPIGFEFGFTRRLHVVRTRPEDWENTGVDLTGFIAAVNRFKLGRAIFCVEQPTYSFGLHPGTGEVTGIIKVAGKAGPSALILLNRNLQKPQRAVIDDIGRCLPGRGEIKLFDPLRDFFGEAVGENAFSRELSPAGILVLLRG
ncbi:MAG: alpha-amylase family glycosyl hydrolase [Candidatus Glassbacteria bacterium]